LQLNGSHRSFTPLEFPEFCSAHFEQCETASQEHPQLRHPPSVSQVHIVSCSTLRLNAISLSLTQPGAIAGLELSL